MPTFLYFYKPCRLVYVVDTPYRIVSRLVPVHYACEQAGARLEYIGEGSYYCRLPNGVEVVHDPDSTELSIGGVTVTLKGRDIKAVSVGDVFVLSRDRVVVFVHPSRLVVRAPGVEVSYDIKTFPTNR